MTSRAARSEVHLLSLRNRGCRAASFRNLQSTGDARRARANFSPCLRIHPQCHGAVRQTPGQQFRSRMGELASDQNSGPPAFAKETENARNNWAKPQTARDDRKPDAINARRETLPTWKENWLERATPACQKLTSQPDGARLSSTRDTHVVWSEAKTRPAFEAILERLEQASSIARSAPRRRSTEEPKTAIIYRSSSKRSCNLRGPRAAFGR